MQYTRCFLAAELTGPAIVLLERTLAELRKTFPDQVRWVENDQLHLVLKSIGDVEDTELADLCQLVRRAAASTHTLIGSLGRLGSSPAGGQPRVIWAGISEGADEICQLQSVFEQSLLGFGVSAQRRRYRPTVTLGRARKLDEAAELSAWLAKKTANLASSFEVDSVALLCVERVGRRMQTTCLDQIELPD